jgi:hypothetical protein
MTYKETVGFEVKTGWFFFSVIGLLPCGAV